jgi:hypothetical protein
MPISTYSPSSHLYSLEVSTVHSIQYPHRLPNVARSAPFSDTNLFDASKLPFKLARTTEERRIEPATWR